MYYTPAMKSAFHSVRAPKDFSGVDLFENEHFLTIRLDEKTFYSLSDDDKRAAIEYVIKVKKALEDNGAMVLVVRKSIGESK
jgi:hypothetical protein